MNIEPNLFPSTHEISPANTEATICPRQQVGGNCTWCQVRALVCSDLLTAESVRVVLLRKQQRGVLQASTALRLAAPCQVIQKSGRIHIFSSARTRDNGNDVLFFALLLALICFNSSTLLSSLIASSFLKNKTSFLS